MNSKKIAIAAGHIGLSRRIAERMAKEPSAVIHADTTANTNTGHWLTTDRISASTFINITGRNPSLMNRAQRRAAGRDKKKRK